MWPIEMKGIEQTEGKLQELLMQKAAVCFSTIIRAENHRSPAFPVVIGKHKWVLRMPWN
jgi:hypothetical protein